LANFGIFWSFLASIKFKSGHVLMVRVFYGIYDAILKGHCQILPYEAKFCHGCLCYCHSHNKIFSTSFDTIVSYTITMPTVLSKLDQNQPPPATTRSHEHDAHKKGKCSHILEKLDVPIKCLKCCISCDVCAIRCMWLRAMYVAKTSAAMLH
jgi:hypothetical protein